MRIKVFYGWWIVIASLSILSVVFGVSFYSFGVFFKPLAAEFGWGRAAISGAMSLLTFLWGVSAPLGGRLSDRFGPKKVMLVSSIPFGASLLLLARTQTLWHLYVFYALLALSYGGITMVPVSSLVNRWFQGKKGLALGITFSGVSLGGMVFAPVIGLLIGELGWRDTYSVLGAGSLAVILPLVLGVIKDGPGPVANTAGNPRPVLPRAPEPVRPAPPVSPTNTSDASPPTIWGTGRMLRSPVFWSISISFFLVNLGQIAVLTHEVPFLTDRGISPLVAASTLGFTSGMGILGKLVTGYLADRFSRVSITVGSFILQAVGLFVLMEAGSMPLVWVFVVVFGASIGGTAVIRPLMVAEYFGERSFAVVYGWIELTRLLGATIGPFFAGWVYDTTQSYTWAFIPFIILFLVGIPPLLWMQRTVR
ncbi:MAG: MFS transporter [Chloroflexi bacterium]|nr:MFS transporter [Chloroflexota bacterium]